MGLEITGRNGEVWTSVTGADYIAEKKGDQAGEAHPSPAAPQEDTLQDVYVTTEKVWGPDNGQGLRHLLYPKGTRIPMSEAIALGLVAAPVEQRKERAVEDKKTRSASTKKGAATRRAPKTPADS